MKNKNSIFFENIYIIGLGLIGSSIAKTIKEKNKRKKIKIFGYDIDNKQNKLLKENKIIDDILLIEDFHKLNNCYVILAVDVDNAIKLLEKFNKIFEQNKNKKFIISDTCSVKKRLMDFVENECQFLKYHFSSIHPMFGGRKAKTTDEIKIIPTETLCYIVKSKKTPRLVDQIIEYEFIDNILQIPSEYLAIATHDKEMSKTSHIPHILADILHKCDAKLTKEALDLVLQIKENSNLWNGIFKENHQNISIELKKFEKIFNKDYHYTKHFGDSFEEAFNKLQDDCGLIDFSIYDTPSSQKLRSCFAKLTKEFPQNFHKLLQQYY